MTPLQSVAALLWSLAFAAAETDPLVARCHELQQQPKEAIAACEAAFSAHAGDDSAELAQEMLFRRSDAEIAVGDFDAAQATLDRAAVLPGAGDAWMNAYRLQRRRGILAYRRGQFADALAAFRVARDMAASNGDAVAEGHSWNDLGNALRRIGSYREALEAYLASLRKKRSADDEQLGALMNNLGDLYRDLNDPKSAREYYLQALEQHRLRGRTLDLAHTHESLATLALDTRDFDAARAQLDLAAATFESLGARTDQIRVAARLARLGLDSSDVPAARSAVALGLTLSRQLGMPLSADLSLETARLALLDHDAAQADVLVSAALARLAPQAPERVALLKVSAMALAQLDRTREAYAQALAFQQADAAQRDAEHDKRLEQLRIRFDVAEKERALETLAAEGRVRALTLQQRTTQLELVAASALLALLLIALATYRSRERLRMAAARREAQLQSESAYFRDAAAELQGDMRRVQALLDRSDSALIALDSTGGVVAASLAATKALRVDALALRGRRLDEFIDASSADRLSEALARIDEGSSSVELTVSLQGNDASTTHPATLMLLDAADGASTVLQIAVDGVADVDIVASELQQRRLQQAGARIAATDVATTADVEANIARIEAEADALARKTGGAGDDDPDRFRRELVDLMVSTLAAWEQSTRTGAIDLAEKSRVWRVAIDDGRLRVRAMERYLSLAKIPRHPRWREVLRTAYYVLAEAPLDADTRADLRRRSEAVQALVRRRALV